MLLARNIYGFLFIQVLLISLLYGERHKPVIAARYCIDTISIDGVLDELTWQSEISATAFIQKSPRPRNEATEKTVVWVVFDSSNVYVAARLFDTSPDSIARDYFRRDGAGYSDEFGFGFDSYLDGRTGYTFSVSPVGIQRDVLIYDDVKSDPTWNAIWESCTKIDSIGWIVEAKIPLSQLRYKNKETREVWGIQFWRYIARYDEYSYWSPWLPEMAGNVSCWGRLYDLNLSKQPLRYELLPYVSNTTIKDSYIGDVNIPFSHSKFFGLDYKYGISSNFTLAGTIYPDYGQVNADPATINLSAYETFYEEHRPFFKEGTEIFQFGTTRTYSSDAPILFYSRRAGSYPRINLPRGGLDPQPMKESPILTAFKISGKSDTGWSVGAMDIISQNMRYSFRDSGEIKKMSISPPGNAFLLRAKKDLFNGRSVFGAFFESKHQYNITDGLESIVPSSTYLAGVDFEHEHRSPEIIVSGIMTMSEENGSPKYIQNMQEASTRYFQRPDAEFLHVDTTLRRLSGYSIELSVQKNVGPNWLWSLTYGDVSPGFEANSLGYQTRADYRSFNAYLEYQQLEESTYLKAWNWWVGAYPRVNYGGYLVGNGAYAGLYFKFKNLWKTSVIMNSQLESLDDRLTRGGPIAAQLFNFYLRYTITSDYRKPLGVKIFYSNENGKSGKNGYSVGGSLYLRPDDNLNVEFQSEYRDNFRTDQFVTSFKDTYALETFGRRYLFSDLSSQSLNSEFTFNWTYSPRFTIQFYGRPSIGRYNYNRPKEFKTPGKYEFNEYSTESGTLIETDGVYYLLDPDAEGPSAQFNIYLSDFNYISFQSNAVLRYEYKLGSTVYFVWQQERYKLNYGVTTASTENIFNELSNIRPNNTIVIKASYRLGA